eukprot:2033868-Amphidinium_carterae.1
MAASLHIIRSADTVFRCLPQVLRTGNLCEGLRDLQSILLAIEGSMHVQIFHHCPLHFVNHRRPPLWGLPGQLTALQALRAPRTRGLSSIFTTSPFNVSKFASSTAAGS